MLGAAVPLGSRFFYHSGLRLERYVFHIIGYLTSAPAAGARDLQSLNGTQNHRTEDNICETDSSRLIQRFSLCFTTI